MEPYQKRIVEKRDVLASDKDALEDFILNNIIFLSLPETDRQLLADQFYLMTELLDVLNKRIARFT